MRKVLLCVLLFTVSAFGQVSPQITGAGAPSNSTCTTSGQMYVNTTNGDLYTCHNDQGAFSGTWGLIPNRGSNVVTSGGGGFASGSAGSGFQDVTEIAAPANPAAGVERIYSDSTTHVLSCLKSSGASCLTGAGTVTATGGSLTSNAVVLGAGTTDTKVSTGITTNGVAELDIGVAGTNGVLGLKGTTSGTATFTAPAIAGTAGNPIVSSNALGLPIGTKTLPSLAVGGQATTGLWGDGSGNIFFTSGGTNSGVLGLSQLMLPALSAFTWSGGDPGINAATVGWSVPVAGNTLSLGTGAVGSEAGLLRAGNGCRVTADITLTVNTAITICTWSLPQIAKAWAWQCEIPWVISAGSGTNTIAIIATPSQTPTGTTNGFAEILTTNTGTATEATTAISASGATTLLTSGTITPAATVFSSRTSGTLLASATLGTFAIQMTAAGTTATAAAKAGSTCLLY